jgi:hypothetical protein
MTLQEIQKAAVGGGLTLVRLPLDTLLRVAPGGATARLRLDRADATARSVLGLALANEALQDDAARRRTAADERERAVRLRDEAHAKTERAEERVEERAQAGTQRRRRAESEAEQRKGEVSQRRNARKSGAAKTAQRRRQAARKDAASAKQRTADRGKRDRADSLEATSDALRERDAALTAADEADRLGGAAAQAKARRKNDG